MKRTVVQGKILSCTSSVGSAYTIYHILSKIDILMFDIYYKLQINNHIYINVKALHGSQN
jgi:hypothetical protein